MILQFVFHIKLQITINMVSYFKLGLDLLDIWIIKVIVVKDVTCWNLNMSYWMSWILKHVDDEPEEDPSKLNDNNNEMFDMDNNTACRSES